MKIFELRAASLEELQELVGKRLKEGTVTAVEERGNYVEFYVDDARPLVPVSYHRGSNTVLQLDDDYASLI